MTDTPPIAGVRPPKPARRSSRPGRCPRRSRRGQWRLVWWKFKKHRLAVAGGIVVLLIYLVALFAEFLAPDGAARLQRALHLRAAAAAPFLGRDRASTFTSTATRSSVNPRASRASSPSTPRRRFRSASSSRASPTSSGASSPATSTSSARSTRATRCILWGADRLGRDMLSRIDPRHAHLDVDRPRRRRLSLSSASSSAASRATTAAGSTTSSSASSSSCSRSRRSRSGWALPRRCRRPRCRRCRSIS